MKKFYVTTPIYYTNGLPHIGHAYSTLLADILARYKRITGHDVKFSTGTDENSQKIVNKAIELGKDVQTYLDEAAQMWLDTWDKLDISYTDFIRTTDQQHQDFVQKVLAISYDRGDIYQGIYKGFYCVGCEAFKKSSDLTEEGTCPIHLTPPQQLNEQNWFFKLSKYESALLEHYRTYPTFCWPEFRFNEVISFVQGGLEDFSISRESNKIGIPLPFAPDQVTYVWYDALLNYLTTCQDGEQDFRDSNTEIVHVMAKDITRFHAVYRPAMLLSAGYRLPDQMVITGYLTLKDHKISKSLGNVVNPIEWADQYDRDALVVYLFGDLTIGSDGNITEERIQDIARSMLVGGWGNLVSRLTNLGMKYELSTGQFDAQLHQEFMQDLTDNPLAQALAQPRSGTFFDQVYINQYACKKRIEDWYALVSRTNELLQHYEPWKLYKDPATQDQAVTIVQYGLWLLKQLGILSAPFLINGFAKLQTCLGNEEFSQLTTTMTTAEETISAVRGRQTLPVSLTKGHLYEIKEKVVTTE